MRLFLIFFLTLPFLSLSQNFTNTDYYISEEMSLNGGDPVKVKIGISVDLDRDQIIIHLDEPLRFTIESSETIDDGNIQYNCIDPYNDNWGVNLKVIKETTLITFWLDVNSYFTYSCRQVYDAE